MISRIRRYVGAHGFRATAAQAARRLRREVFSRDRITVLLKELDQISEPRRASRLRLEGLGEEHLGSLSKLNRLRGRPGVDRRFRENLRRGLRGFVAFSDAEAVGYYWWVDRDGAGRHPDLEWLAGAFRFEPGDVYGSDFYVLPEHRAGGTANEILFRVESALRERGYERIWGYVDSGNREARWLYSSRGYRPTRDLTVRRILFRRRSPRSL
jgi:GNAT superfamily N-acetyltransferase